MKKHTVRYIVLSIIALLLAAACCAGAYMLLNGRNAGAGESKVIFECSPESVESIRIIKGNYRYELEKDDGVWEFDEDERELPVQQSVIEAVNVFSSIKGTEVKPETEPLFSIRVEIDREFGDEVFELAKDNEKYYLKNKRGKIYAVSQVLYSVADREKGYYRDKTVVPIKSFGAEGENKFVSYNFKYKDADGKTNEINVRLKNAAEVKRYENSSHYMMDVPYLRTVDAVDFESKVLTKIPDIKAESFIADVSTDLSLFGLDEKTRGTLTVKYDDKSFVMYVGKAEEAAANVYCMLPRSKEIFTVKGSSLDFLGYDSFEIADKSIFPYNNDYIKSVRVEADGIKLNIRSDGQNYYIGERPVSKETVQSFLAELKKLKASGVEFEAYNGGGLMKVTLTGSDGAVINYKVIKTEDGRVLVSEDGKVYMKIELKDIEAFTEYLKQLEKIPV